MTERYEELVALLEEDHGAGPITRKVELEAARTIRELMWAREKLKERIAKERELEAGSRKNLQERIIELERICDDYRETNESVAVCKDHCAEVTLHEGCLVCDLQDAEREVEKLRKECEQWQAYRKIITGSTEELLLIPRRSYTELMLDKQRLDWLEAEVFGGNCHFWDYFGEARWFHEIGRPYNKRVGRSARKTIDEAMEEEK